MSQSQFTIYTSSDPYGPGAINGLTGSLLTVLDACLVNGYGTGSNYKAPAGWTKPLPNVSGSLGCYKQGSGSQFTMFVNDSGPNTSAAAREAWVTGWESMTSLAPSGSVFTASNSAGSGYGQFPLPPQLLTYGHVVWRKSVANDYTSKSWMIMADASTMYMWINTADTTAPPFYMHYGFGDFYSLAGTNDKARCFIYGRVAENAAGSAGQYDWTDLISFSNQIDTGNQLSVAQPGHFLARNAVGGASSVGFTKKGDNSYTGTTYGSSPYACAINGIISIPTVDNSLILSPIYIVEPAGPSLRGRLRGMYHMCHPASSFTDGQTIQGSNDFAGKSFMIVKPGISTVSMWTMETSPTVETN